MRADNDNRPPPPPARALPILGWVRPNGAVELEAPLAGADAADVTWSPSDPREA